MKTPKPKSSATYQHKTLDTHHTQRMKAFEDSRSELDAMRCDAERLREAVAEYEARGKSTLSSEELEAYLSLRDSLGDLWNRISRIESSGGEIDYYVNAGNILFQYYDVLEKGNASIVDAPTSAHSILRYFSKPAAPSQPQPPARATDTARASLLDKYMMSVNNGMQARVVAAADSAASSTADDEASAFGPCEHCGSKERTPMWNDGYIVCNGCHSIENLLVDHEKPSYKDPFPEITYWAYKRVNHFSEWVSQVQARETTDIPEEVYDKILFEIKKQKITNLADVTTFKLKEILKKMGGKYNKYYEHIPHILHRLNGLPVPHFGPELEERLRQMFFQIQVPFLKHAPKNRKNFLSYSYVLNKFMTLLNQDQYLSSFPLLKSREKLHQQDMIWKKICEELGWEFVRSL